MGAKCCSESNEKPETNMDNNKSKPTSQERTADDNTEFIQPLMFLDENGEAFTVKPDDPDFKGYLDQMKEKNPEAFQNYMKMAQAIVTDPESLPSQYKVVGSPPETSRLLVDFSDYDFTLDLKVLLHLPTVTSDQLADPDIQQQFMATFYVQLSEQLQCSPTRFDVTDVLQRDDMTVETELLIKSSGELPYPCHLFREIRSNVKTLAWRTDDEEFLLRLIGEVSIDSWNVEAFLEAAATQVPLNNMKTLGEPGSDNAKGGEASVDETPTKRTSMGSCAIM